MLILKRAVKEAVVILGAIPCTQTSGKDGMTGKLVTHQLICSKNIYILEETQTYLK
jgi:hypothetical protein